MMKAAGTENWNHFRKEVVAVSPEQRQILKALTVLCCSKAILLFLDGLLPEILHLIVRP